MIPVSNFQFPISGKDQGLLQSASTRRHVGVGGFRGFWQSFADFLDSPTLSRIVRHFSSIFADVRRCSLIFADVR